MVRSIEIQYDLQVTFIIEIISFLYQIIRKTYEEKQSKLIADAKTKGSVDLIGDEQCDSAGRFFSRFHSEY